MKPVTNALVAEAWALGKPARNHRGSFWTDGKRIYSYELQVGDTSETSKRTMTTPHHLMTFPIVGDNVEENSFSLGSIRRVAKQIVDLGDKKRKELLMTFDSDMRCRIIEEMVNIRITRSRTNEASN